MKSVWKRKNIFWHALCRHELNSVMWFLKSEKWAILRIWKVVHLFEKIFWLLCSVCVNCLILFWYSVLFWYNIWKPLAWCTGFRIWLCLYFALLCYALLCLGWYQLLCLWVHPLWKQSGFIVVFPVCTLGAPRRIKERFHLCLCLVWPPGLAQPYHGGETWSLLCLMLCFDLMMILSLCYAKAL